MDDENEIDIPNETCERYQMPMPKAIIIPNAYKLTLVGERLITLVKINCKVSVPVRGLLEGGEQVGVVRHERVSAARQRSGLRVLRRLVRLRPLWGQLKTMSRGAKKTLRHRCQRRAPPRRA